MSYEAFSLVSDFLTTHQDVVGIENIAPDSSFDPSEEKNPLILANENNSVYASARLALEVSDVDAPDLAVGLDAKEFSQYLSYLKKDVNEAISAAEALGYSLRESPVLAGGSNQSDALAKSVDNLITRLKSVKDDIDDAQKYQVPPDDRMEVAQGLYRRAENYQNSGIQSLESLAGSAERLPRRGGNV